MFPYRWNLSDGYPAAGVENHGKTVFGTFVCGGGSTMGYKLAGYHHLGGVELDKRMAEIYKENHSPEHLYVEDIRAFNQRADLPDSLYDLDLLDGSPPCSSFSTAGNREKDWGKKKKFAEGQSEQVLDDLVYVYAKTIKKLMPKVAVLENVKGIISGNAKQYAVKIKAEIESYGYRVQVFLCDAATMGVPQRRQRVFFIALRNDIELPPIVINFDQDPIPFRMVEDDTDQQPSLTEMQHELWMKCSMGKSFSSIHPTGSWFNSWKVSPHLPVPTILASGGVGHCHHKYPRQLNKAELCRCGSFPKDFDFIKSKPRYVIGMSVPPVMTAQIADQIYKQWLCST